jgi:hypothetical protein
MNDLELLKEFRSGRGDELDEADAETLWTTVRERMGTARGPAVVRRARHRRWALAAAVAATVAALVLALPAILPSDAPSGPPRASAAISFATEGNYLVAVIKDPQADADELRAAFAQHGLDISLQLVPVSPSMVGKFVYEGDSGTDTGPPIETLFDDSAECTTPGSLSCPIGLRIPLDFTGHAELSLGRAADSGEDYATTNDAFAPGEALHCSELRGMTVHGALPVLEQLSVTAVWRSNDQSIDRVDGIDPATIAGQYVTDALPLAPGQVYVWASTEQPTEPEPGTPLADYFARLERGC